MFRRAQSRFLVILMTIIIKFTNAPIYFAGSTANSTWTPNVGNTGVAVLTPTTISTNGTTSGLSAVLNFASTTGVANGESIKCGGAASGVYPYSIVLSFTGSTVTMNQKAVLGGGINGVPSSLSCTFSYTLTSTAVPGTYTITATGASTYNITAPAGGNTQSGIAVAGGMLTFKDVVIPITGNAVATDSFTLVVPQATTREMVTFIDKANSISDPWFEIPASGSYSSAYSPIPSVAGIPGFGNVTSNYKFIWRQLVCGNWFSE